MVPQLLLPVAFGLLASFVTPGYALPVDDSLLGFPDNVSMFNDTAPALFARQNKFELRIMAFGASIMSGQGSSTRDGCRRFVREALRGEGWPVNMVGSQHSGDMKDYDHEAVPGDIIDQAYNRLQNGVPFKPNMVMINLGTNDALRSVDVSNAGTRMRKVLDYIWAAPGMSTTCVFLSTLLPTDDLAGATNRVTINNQYRQLICDLAKAGKCIYLAEMEHPTLWQGGDFIDSEKPKVHPNDNGHRRMASVFMNAIHRAINENKIQKVSGDFATVVGPSSCPKFAGSGISAGGLTQRGSGDDDGIYYHSSEDKGVRLTVESDFDRDQWRFARLFSRDYDDLMGWWDTNGKHTFGVWKNSADGNGAFTKISDADPDMYCIPRGLHFIDMNGDGLDDVVCIEPAGSLLLSINQGNGDRAAGRPPTFKRVPGQIKKEEGYLQANVRLGDFDGDGRGDYAVLTESGDIRVWRNGGTTEDAPPYWHDLGVRFQAKGKGDGRGVRFEDINGDGRDDWMWVSDVGATETWTNSRSCVRAGGEFGLNFAWRQGFASGQSSGNTHAGMAGFVTKDETYLRDRIHFARIYGEDGAWGMLGKQDYVFMQHSKNGNKHKFEMKVWKNKGSGATKVKQDGNKYCNMMGWADGRSDYVWTWSTGKMHLYANRGRSVVYDGDAGFWDEKGDIWTPPRNIDRRDLHLADWNGDGTCDIIYVNPEGGKVEVWLNNYPTTKTWTWTYLGNPAPALGCAQKRGLGFEDKAVRFADLTGNKRTDYLCIEPNGRVTAFVQGDTGGFSSVGQIKYSVGKDRANLRWTDVDGDGKADMIWIDKYTGNTDVWYNNGRADPATNSGSSFRWTLQDKRAYDGNAAGVCEYYTDLNGDGRADQHNVIGSFTNEARTWFAPACGLSDRTGDDAIGASLPSVPDNPTCGTGSNPGNPDNPPQESNEKWKQIKCTDSGLTNSADPSEDRWKAAYATDAFDAAVLNYKGNKNQVFSRAVSNFFNGKDNIRSWFVSIVPIFGGVPL